MWGAGGRPLCQSHLLIIFATAVSVVSSPELHPGRSRVPTFSKLTHNGQNFYPSWFHQTIQWQQMNRIVHTSGLLCIDIQWEEHFLSSPCHTAKNGGNKKKIKQKLDWILFNYTHAGFPRNYLNEHHSVPADKKVLIDNHSLGNSFKVSA